MLLSCIHDESCDLDISTMHSLFKDPHRLFIMYPTAVSLCYMCRMLVSCSLLEHLIDQSIDWLTEHERVKRGNVPWNQCETLHGWWRNWQAFGTSASPHKPTSTNFTLCTLYKKNYRSYIPLNGNQSLSYGASPVVWYYTRHRWTRLP